MPIRDNLLTADYRRAFAKTPAHELAEEHARLVDELRKASAQHDAYTADLPAAREADAEALTAALVAGRDDPGTAAEDALKRDIALAERRVSGFLTAVRAALDALMAKVASEGTDWLTDISDARAEATSRLADVVQTLNTTLDEIDELDAQGRFIERIVEGGPEAIRSERDLLARPRPLITPGSTNSGAVIAEGFVQVSRNLMSAALATYGQPVNVPPTVYTVKIEEGVERRRVGTVEALLKLAPKRVVRKP